MIIPVKFKQPVSSSDGYIIEGKTEDDIVNAIGGTMSLSEDIAYDIDGVVHITPREIVFSSSTYTLNDKSKFVILLYNGVVNSTVTLTDSVKQTVYIANTNDTVTVTTPAGVLEGKIGHKFFYSEELNRWLFMGIFEFEML